MIVRLLWPGKSSGSFTNYSVSKMQNKIQVEGAEIYYSTQGKGPKLLIIQGGAGDADLTNDMLTSLCSNYTVVTYDRRGLSRSKIIKGPPADLATHTNDVYAIIETLGEPAMVFASSIGAIIGLNLIEQYPAAVRKLIAHEPPVPAILPGPKQATAEINLDTLQDTFNEQGFGAALQYLSGFLGIDPNDHEAEATPIQVTPQFISNMEFYFINDVPAGRSYIPHLSKLSTHNNLVFAAGEASAKLWPHHCALAFAKELRSPFVLFPGGHNGPTAYPKAFAMQLLKLL